MEIKIYTQVSPQKNVMFILDTEDRVVNFKDKAGTIDISSNNEQSNLEVNLLKNLL